MGMAASQARFLNLTARKTNIEYQGQQINQQRTELSNQSANLYNQMLQLQVPTPPNSNEFTKIQYTFNIPGNYNTLATITQFSKDQYGTYTVLFTYTETEMGFPACSTSQRSNVSGVTSNTYIYTADDGTTYQVKWDGSDYKYSIDGGTNWINLNKVTSQPEDEPDRTAWTNYAGGSILYKTDDHVYFEKEVIEAITTSTPVAVTSYSGGLDYAGQNVLTYKGKSATLQQVTATGDHKDAFKALHNGSNSVWVTNIGTEEKPVYQYYTSSDIETANSSGDGKCVYYYAGDVDVYKEDSYEGVTIVRDGSNRVLSFNYNGEDYAVTANTVTDEEAYNDAMNEYTYKSYLYEQEMANINAKTSIIQIQDRDLELRLKQLDTEHNAVQTESEAVQSVCKKNVEDSFKTFA